MAKRVWKKEAKLLKKNQLGSVRSSKNSDGSFSVRYEASITTNGKRDTKTLGKTFKGTSVSSLTKQVQDHAEWATTFSSKLKKENTKAGLVKSGDALQRTFIDLYDEFIVLKADNTIENYDRVLKFYYPFLLETKLRELNLKHADLILAKVRQREHREGIKLSDSTIEEALKPLWGIIKYAYNKYKIPEQLQAFERKTLQVYMKEKGFNTHRKSDKEVGDDLLPVMDLFKVIDFYDWRTKKGLRVACRDQSWVAFMIGLMLGLRSGEIRALRPSSRDGDEINITDQITKKVHLRYDEVSKEFFDLKKDGKRPNSGRVFELKDVKNKVVIHDRVLPDVMLRVFDILDETVEPNEFYLTCDKDRFIEMYGASDLEYRNFLDAERLRFHIRDIVFRATGKKSKVHDLRHLFAGIFRKVGGHRFHLQDLLNHKNQESTLRYNKMLDIAYSKKEITYLKTRIKLGESDQHIELIR